MIIVLAIQTYYEQYGYVQVSYIKTLRKVVCEIANRREHLHLRSSSNFGLYHVKFPHIDKVSKPKPQTLG